MPSPTAVSTASAVRNIGPIEASAAAPGGQHQGQIRAVHQAVVIDVAGATEAGFAPVREHEGEVRPIDHAIAVEIGEVAGTGVETVAAEISRTASGFRDHAVPIGMGAGRSADSTLSLIRAHAGMVVREGSVVSMGRGFRHGAGQVGDRGMMRPLGWKRS